MNRGTDRVTTWIGLATLSLVLGGLCGLFWLGPLADRDTAWQRVAVLFARDEGVRPGASVLYGGVHVGRVEDTRLEVDPAVDGGVRVRMTLRVPDTPAMPLHEETRVQIHLPQGFGYPEVHLLPADGGVRLGSDSPPLRGETAADVMGSLATLQQDAQDELARFEASVGAIGARLDRLTPALRTRGRALDASLVALEREGKALGRASRANGKAIETNVEAIRALAEEARTRVDLEAMRSSIQAMQATFAEVAAETENLETPLAGLKKSLARLDHEAERYRDSADEDGLLTVLTDRKAQGGVFATMKAVGEQMETIMGTGIGELLRQNKISDRVLYQWWWKERHRHDTPPAMARAWRDLVYQTRMEKGSILFIDPEFEEHDTPHRRRDVARFRAMRKRFRPVDEP